MQLLDRSIHRLWCLHGRHCLEEDVNTLVGWSLAFWGGAYWLHGLAALPPGYRITLRGKEQVQVLCMYMIVSSIWRQQNSLVPGLVKPQQQCRTSAGKRWGGDPNDRFCLAFRCIQLVRKIDSLITDPGCNVLHSVYCSNLKMRHTLSEVRTAEAGMGR